MSARITAAFLGLCVAQASAATIAWTGIIDNNQWETANNWNPAQVPGPNDDVVIQKGDVQLTAAASVASLTMGGLFGKNATLTLFKAFFVSGSLTVQGNGFLNINTGLDTVSGTVDVAGTVTVVDGTLGGEWTVSKIGTADLSNGNEKTLAGCNFVNKGALGLGGVIVLNQSSVFTASGAVTASRNLMVQAQDKTTVLFDASDASSFTYSNGLFSVQAPTKIGNFDLVSGNVTLFNSMSFVQTLNIPTGSVVTALGAITVDMLGVTGEGTLTSQCNELTLGASSGNLNINLLSGSLIFNAKSNISGVLTIDGGAAVASAAVTVGTVYLQSGSVSGSGVLTATAAFLESKGFDINGPVTVSKSFIVGKAILAFAQQGKFTLASTCKATVSGAFQLTGAPYLPGFYNNGEINVAADLASQNVNIRGTGMISAADGVAMTVTAVEVVQAAIELGSKSTFSGASTFLTVGAVSAAATVTATLGDYSLECSPACKNVDTKSSQVAPIVKFAFQG